MNVALCEIEDKLTSCKSTFNNLDMATGLVILVLVIAICDLLFVINITTGLLLAYLNVLLFDYI